MSQYRFSYPLIIFLFLQQQEPEAEDSTFKADFQQTGATVAEILKHIVTLASDFINSEPVVEKTLKVSPKFS